MRTIKFRAWDKIRNIMINNWDLSLKHDDIMDFMQFTGLKDKNGKEIYEGDIVEFTNPWDEESVGWIEYRDDNMSFVITTKTTYDLISECPSDMTLNIIGNISENPELLTPPTGA